MGSWALEWASIRDGCLSQAAGVREGFLDRGGAVDWVSDGLAVLLS